MKIREYCSEIASLLKSVGEESWANSFKTFSAQTELPDKDLAREILKLYGGMGSFNDLVIYKDGQVCQEENDMLEKLRNELYKLLISAL